MAKKKVKTPQKETLFQERLVPGKPGSGDLFEVSYEGRDGQPVECLGMTFDSDEARREHFLQKLKEKLPELRKRPDFPLGPDGGPAADEDILRLSDPPYYTACPNPFLAEFVEHYGRPYDPDEPYHREPFAVDVSEGKTDQLYKAHGYHTKVPHLAIVPSILHYTKPGDIVLDGFCGSGMTGVAAQWCGTAPKEYREKIEQRWKEEERDPPEWGARRVILGDLSPAATFIAANYNIPFDVDAFAAAARQLLDEVEEELGWMYETLHTDGKTKGRINYTVWSEVFSCPECAGEIVYVEEALDQSTKRVRDQFPCPHCGATVAKRLLQKKKEHFFDPYTNATYQRNSRVPVLINYTVGKVKHEKKPDAADLDLIKKIDGTGIHDVFPTSELPYAHMTHERVRIADYGVHRVHHFYFPRQLCSFAAMWRITSNISAKRLKNSMLFFVEQCAWGLSILNMYGPSHFSQVNRYLSGVYYVPSQTSEVSPWYILDGKLARLHKAFTPWPSMAEMAAITTGDCASTSISEDSIDYIFTDPPFGENIYYADLNLLVESWHRVLTRSEPEAIVDKAKKKGVLEYQHLMQRCFEEYYRVLKPGRWMTVVFHNSKNAIWNAIQEAMLAAGFVVADVRTLDKKQGSYRQITSTAVKQDLVISAYKPNHGLEQRFTLKAGTEDGAWDFVRTHMRQLPVFVSKNGQAEVIAERQDYLLFDRMVAFHVQRGVKVPLSAAEFYQGLAERFAERDGMYFLPEQAAEYDRKRMTVKEVLQLEMFVKDEASAIQWIKQQLTKKPQTFQELQPQFMREIAGWEKYEQPLELSEMLQQNFLCYDGQGEVPSQIHSYLSSNFHELRNLDKDDPKLIEKAKGRWYVPDPRKEADLEKIRHRALMREFEQYRQSKGKLKVVRSEALRAGFKECWQNGDYRTIVAMAKRVKEDIIQEDPALLMYYDNALMRTEE